MKRATLLLVVAALLMTTSLMRADTFASIFLTGHDPDFHASLGGNSAGAKNINKMAINFVTDPVYNVYSAGGITKFLYVAAFPADIGGVPSGHWDGKQGLVDSGYVLGTDFDQVNAAGLAGALAGLGTIYDAIVVGSSFGGLLTQAELNALNANSAAIIAFLNSGGGLYAMSEGDVAQSLALGGGYYGYLPCVTSDQGLNQGEAGFTVTAFGQSIGLTANDVNGNASHNIFPANGTCGMNIVDLDASGEIMSLAAHGKVTGGGIDQVPEPISLVLFGTGLLGLAAKRRK